MISLVGWCIHKDDNNISEGKLHYTVRRENYKVIFTLTQIPSSKLLSLIRVC